MLLLLLACHSPEGSSDDTSTPTPATCSGGSGGTALGSAEVWDGMNYFLFAPDPPPVCAPLVFFGHSGNNPGGITDGVWDDGSSTKFPDLALDQGFVFVAPGANVGNAPHEWSFEVTAKLDALTGDLGQRYDIDTSRVWFVGLSAGGSVSAYYGLYDPGVVTGVGVVAAGIGSYFDYPKKEPDPKLPFFVAHNPDDQVVPYQYSVDLATALEEHGHTYVFQDWDLGQEDGHGWNPDLTPVILDWLNANPS